MADADDLYTSSWQGLDVEALPAALRGAYDALTAHPCAHEVRLYSYDLDDTYVALAATLDVALPSRGTVGGVDIRAQEPVVFLLHRERRVLEAPRVLADRRDFPKTLPHLNPTPTARPASLCLHRGSIDEWFAEHTFDDFVDRARGWLADAAAGQLIKEVDRFEPMRVDEHGGIAVFPYAQLLDVLSAADAPKYRYAPLEFTQSMPPGEGDTPYRPVLVFNERLIHRQVEQRASTIRKRNEVWRRGGAPLRTTLGVLVWPEEGRITPEYFGTRPTTFIELVALCEKAGCPLRSAVRGLAGWMAKGGLKPDWLPVVMAVRRPMLLVGQTSDVELLVFVVENGELGGKYDPVPDDAPVHALLHLEPLTRRRAVELSRHDAEPPLPHIALLGAGALGSKMALHLGRGGHDHLTIVDNDLLWHHNLVRHALSANELWQGKATALRETLRSLFPLERGQLQVEAREQNALDLLYGISGAALEGHNLIVDATASNTVLGALGDCTLPEPVRVMRCEIADEGRLGIWLLEGRGRSPRIDDLRALLYTRAREDENISNWLKSFRQQRSEVDESLLEEIQLGVSCGSSTLRLSDEVVSFHAAAMTMALRSQPESGEVGLTWHKLAAEEPFGSRRIPVGSTQVLTANEAPGWEVRLLAPAAVFMRDMLHRDQPNETGGILLGQVDVQRHTVYVTEALGPPADSERRPYRFKKGTRGVSEIITSAMAETGGLISYVGEWHTHPVGGTALSSTDRAAVADLRADLDKLGWPTHVMIITPTEFATHLFVPDGLR
jgi:proteasome lid subunit RPN8/RPN11